MTQAKSDSPIPKTDHFWEHDVPPGFNFWSLVIERYGPFAFGVFLLLAVWQVVAKPQIDAARIDFEAQQAVVKEFRESMKSFKIISEQQRQTATVLQHTSELLAKTAQEIVNVKRELRHQ